MKAAAKIERLDVYPSAELRYALDLWRVQQPRAPTRAEAARSILAEFLEAQGFLKTATK